jgi:ADP-heptose:LPS heptosyltransferase
MGGLKRWPPGQWPTLASMLRSAGHALVQVGGHADDPVEGVTYDYRGAGLPETAWLLAESDALIAVEGGIVHLAAAVMRPERSVGVIFGPTPVVSFLYPGHIALKGPDLCAPCWQVEPTWKHAQCAIGAGSCVNFPSVTEVRLALSSTVSRRVHVETPPWTPFSVAGALT